jgi:hypothetical protein
MSSYPFLLIFALGKVALPQNVAPRDRATFPEADRYEG